MCVFFSSSQQWKLQEGRYSVLFTAVSLMPVLYMARGGLSANSCGRKEEKEEGREEEEKGGREGKKLEITSRIQVLKPDPLFPTQSIESNF